LSDTVELPHDTHVDLIGWHIPFAFHDEQLMKLRAQVTELNRTPFMHRICLGGRTAVLTMASSQLIAQGIPGEAGDLIKQTDRFAQIDPSSGI
jgi:hypothetical protein